MAALVAYGVIGVAAVIGGVASLAWLNRRPLLRAWAPVGLVVTIGGVAILLLGVGLPVAFWLVLGAP